jgi:hypothetical protein
MCIMKWVILLHHMFSLMTFLLSFKDVRLIVSFAAAFVLLINLVEHMFYCNHFDISN